MTEFYQVGALADRAVELYQAFSRRSDVLSEGKNLDRKERNLRLESEKVFEKRLAKLAGDKSAAGNPGSDRRQSWGASEGNEGGAEPVRLDSRLGDRLKAVWSEAIRRRNEHSADGLSGARRGRRLDVPV